MPDDLFALADGTHVHPSDPFFVTGSGRCGTTLLRRLILGRVQAVIPPENYTLGLSRHGMEMARGDWAAFCGLMLHGVRTYTSNWRDFGIDEHQALDLLTGLPQTSRTMANFWHGFHALYAAGLGKPAETRWGDKTPANVGRLDELRAIFPAARFVFMVRDVFDTAYSFGCMPRPDRSDNFLSGAERWLDANVRLLDFAARFPCQTLILRYEDLVGSLDQTLRRLLDFLQLPPSQAGAPTVREACDLVGQPHLRNVLEEVTVSAIGKGRAHLPPAVRHQVALMAAPVQIHLGYEPTGHYRHPLLAMETDLVA